MATVVVVASGLTGKFLLEDARASLKVREGELRGAGLAADEIEKELLSHAFLAGTMKQWRKVHLPLAMVFLALALLHVSATLLFWRW